MNIKLLLASALVLGASVSSFAQGYKDGIEFYKIGQFDNAKELLERNLDNSSTDKSEAYYYLGQVAFEKGDLTGAKSFYDKGVAANANNAYNYVGQAAVALKNGNESEAENLFKAARKLVKKNPKLETAIARAYYQADAAKYAKDIEKCIKSARKYNAKDPDSYIYEGDTEAAKQAWGDAAGMYELAFTYDPENIEAYVKFANTYFNVNPKMAIEKLEELLAKQPNSALVQRQLAEKYYSDNLGAKAAEQYGEYIKNPNHFAQDELRYAQLLFGAGRYQECYDVTTRLGSATDASANQVFFAKRLKLYSLVSLKKWAEAVEVGRDFFATKVTASTPFQANDYINYASALKENGNAEDAVAAYDTALKLDPKNADLMRGLSESYSDVKDFKNAIKYQQMLVESGAGSSNDIFGLSLAYFNLAVTSTEAAEKADAIAQSKKYLEEVNAKVPGNVQIVNQLARVEKFNDTDAKKGTAVQAYKELVKILDAKQDKTGYERYYISAYNYLANYYMNKKDEATAKMYYEKWLENDPQNEALKKYVSGLK
ncbi:MAG: tetratricopeptide repeat protein [Bacteroidales bacterium]|nr:tetratricopeptide repeat protein [Bacteroidales bacterium]